MTADPGLVAQVAAAMEAADDRDLLVGWDCMADDWTSNSLTTGRSR